MSIDLPTPGTRVRVMSGDGTEDLGYGTFLGVVTVFCFSDGSGNFLNTPSPEDRPDQTMVAEKASSGWSLLEDADNPKIQLDDGDIVYGTQVYWTEVGTVQ